jgi:hypothetical protein
VAGARSLSTISIIAGGENYYAKCISMIRNGFRWFWGLTRKFVRKIMVFTQERTHALIGCAGWKSCVLGPLGWLGVGTSFEPLR